MNKKSTSISFEEAPDDLDRLIRKQTKVKLAAKILDEDFSEEVKKAGLVKNLKEPGIQHSIDLHGMTRAEAKMALGEFLLKANKAKLKRVLVITGKGYNSPNKKSVLRDEVRKILSEDQFGIVSGFSYAQPKHGGTGAFDVRLKS